MIFEVAYQEWPFKKNQKEKKEKRPTDFAKE
jgi:hypothetical protein